MRKTLLIVLPLLLISFSISQEPINYETTLIERDGLYTNWYENGQKWYELTIKDGEFDGLYTNWYENGQKSFEGTYKDGELISEKYWNEDGSVKK